MKKTSILLVITLALGLTVGFFGGMQYKAYQIRTAIEKAFTTKPNTTPEKSETVVEQAKKEEMQVVEKNIGDEVTLATIKFKISGVKEAQTISSGYGKPKVAKEGAKFVIINLSITNITTSKFAFYPDDINLIDSQKREFSSYQDSIGIDNYLDYRELSPSITENGTLVYEVPTDATFYSWVIGKAGSKVLYKVLLK